MWSSSKAIQVVRSECATTSTPPTYFLPTKLSVILLGSDAKALHKAANRAPQHSGRTILLQCSRNPARQEIGCQYAKWLMAEVRAATKQDASDLVYQNWSKRAEEQLEP